MTHPLARTRSVGMFLLQPIFRFSLFLLLLPHVLGKWDDALLPMSVGSQIQWGPISILVVIKV